MKSQVLGLDLLGNQDYIDIPFKLEQGYIILKARFHNSVTLDFIFDTGAENIILFDREIAEIFKIPYDRRIKVMGSNLSSDLHANIARQVFFKIGKTNTVKRDVVVLEENVLMLEERLGINVGGIIGGSFFRNLVVKIDYAKKKMRLHHPNKIDWKEFDNYSKFDVHLHNSKPYISANTQLKNGKDLDLTFLLDSGASLPLLLNADSDPLLTLPKDVQLGSLGFGISGMLQGHISQISQLKIGEFEFDDIVTSFQEVSIDNVQDESRPFRRNGLIGNVLLRRFNIIIDYFNSQVHFKPIKKKRYNKAFEYDRSGMTIFAVGLGLNEFLVTNIMPGSPSAEMGIMEGDMIVKIRGRKTSQMSLGAVVSLLQRKAGKKVKLEILRDGERMKKELVLRDWYKR